MKIEPDQPGVPQDDGNAARLLELRLHQRSVEASANAMVITSAAAPDFAIEYVNPAFERITGFSAAEAVGRNCMFLQAGDDEQEGLVAIRRALCEQRAGNAVLRNYRKDGTPFWNHLYIAPVSDAQGTVTHFVASQYDITETRSVQEALRHLATHDPLTGLPNRTLLQDRLQRMMAAAQRHNSHIWVVFLDLDRFKFFNDSLGHKAGDAVLKSVAQRMQAQLRPADTIARLGGDEFVLVLSDWPAGSLSLGLVQRLMDAVRAPYAANGNAILISCSVGIAVYPGDAATAELLVERADVAMYRAKEAGRNSAHFYKAEMNALAMSRLRM
jgi:diguanylate cyclase (GGDEF)-like protein/PAS domain S-box-containing protein